MSANQVADAAWNAMRDEQRRRYTAMLHGNYTEYDGDDGYTTLTLNRCDTCHMQPQHCDCDSNEPTHDTSRSHIT